jgi:hypothetical protein
MQMQPSAILWLTLLVCPAAQAGELMLPEAGAYRVIYRLEVPHVERFAIDASVTVCAGSRAMIPVVLSGNNPLSRCPARNVVRTESRLSFDIVCPGRPNDRSEAKAFYTLHPGGIQGRIAMVMGGKNMTFVEVQSWRHIGACDRLARRG